MKKTRETRVCQGCGKEFEIVQYLLKKGYGKYCSQKCYQKTRWAISGNCAMCGEKSETRFCSAICQKKYWNKYGNGAKKRERQWERKLEIISKLGGACASCGITDIRVLDIHHTIPEDKLIPEKRGYNWARRLRDWDKNIDTLQLLCANCHRVETWKQRGYGVGL